MDLSMSRMKGRRRLTCHHEGGHALVRWFFGYHTDRAVVQTVEELIAGKRVRDRRGRLVACEGIVTGYDICGWPFGRLKISGSAEDQAEYDRVRAVSRDIELINCYAGFYAEAAYARRSVRGCMLAGGGGDIKNSRAILDAWHLPEEERRAVTLAAEALASALVRSPQGAAAIKAIADVLMTRGQASGDRIAALCRKAYGGRECAYGAWVDHWPPTLDQIRTGHIPERRAKVAA
ncbi:MULTISPECIES: hypothetical protein [unclassified Methylobacterium]|uniref:hypothetical protein n=1 Tax=unclassified Methylobacterium TaxID=2615210 RepID=UPI0011C1D8F1|nr:MULTISPECIES: hypothetical protein [unclassified Methylobacterium]QEE37589.1 hypothetical protein FVA80_00070 [Methylobacterium sp. WL1]TXN52328.1 hypothetical protein FV241_29710 [Methylobacterium sp. WL2]